MPMGLNHDSEMLFLLLFHLKIHFLQSFKSVLYKNFLLIKLTTVVKYKSIRSTINKTKIISRCQKHVYHSPWFVFQYLHNGWQLFLQSTSWQNMLHNTKATFHIRIVVASLINCRSFTNPLIWFDLLHKQFKPVQRHTTEKQHWTQRRIIFN